MTVEYITKYVCFSDFAVKMINKRTSLMLLIYHLIKDLENINILVNTNVK